MIQEQKIIQVCITQTLTNQQGVGNILKLAKGVWDISPELADKCVIMEVWAKNTFKYAYKILGHSTKPRFEGKKRIYGTEFKLKWTPNHKPSPYNNKGRGYKIIDYPFTLNEKQMLEEKYKNIF